jgi:hypothetical protein
MSLAARSTVYKGIKMRSRLEAGFAAWLDDAEFSWTYEPRCYASEEGQYLPDFLLNGASILGFKDEYQPVFVEVKPEVNKILINELNRNARIIRSSEPKAVVVLAQPQRRSELWVSDGDREMYAAWAFRSLKPNPGPHVQVAFPVHEKSDGLPWPDGYWS